MDCQYFHLPFLLQLVANFSSDQNFSQTPSILANVTTLAPPLFNQTNTEADELLDSEDIPIETSELVEKIIFIYFVPIICVLGIFGNILSMYLLCSQRSKVSTTYALIGIAIADICYLTCALTEEGLRINRYFNHIEGCSLMNYLWNPLFSYLTKSFARVTAALTIIISIERTVAVTWPMKVKRICTSKSILIISISSTIITFASMIPWLDVWVTRPFRLPGGQQVYILEHGPYFDDKESYNLYFMILELIQKILAVVVVCICNLIIVVTLCSNTFRTKIGQALPTKRRREIEVTKTVTAISILFMITQVPVASYRIGIYVGTAISMWNTFNIVRSVAYFCEVLNSSLNFVIYVGTTQAYRQRLKDLHTRVQIPRCRGKAESKSEHSVSANETSMTIDLIHGRRHCVPKRG